MLGVALNIITIIVGTAIGALFGRLIPERFRQIVFYAIGSCTIGFGAFMTVSGFSDLNASAVGSLAAIVLVVSMVAGSLTGELLRIEDRLESLGKLLGKLVGRRSQSAGAGAEKGAVDGDPDLSQTPSATSTFAEGFMTATIFFCVGAMTVMGSIQAGLGDPSTLYLKATLDGISAIALTTALGFGVGFSVISVLVIQGGIVLGAGFLGDFFTPAIIASIDLVGGVMLIALGLEILGIKKLRVGNMLPALVIAIAMGYFLG
jgi:uncharacterized membrane protein YqgA involved in biofilm formation